MYKVIVGTVIGVLMLAAPAAAESPRLQVRVLSDPVIVESRDNVISHGDTIRFYVGARNVEHPTLGLVCYQGSQYSWGSLVYQSPPGPIDTHFKLESATWTSGEANCVATAYSYNSKTGKHRELESLAFYVAPFTGL